MARRLSSSWQDEPGVLGFRWWKRWCRSGAAWTARSPALLAFGGDSGVELLSACRGYWRALLSPWLFFAPLPGNRNQGGQKSEGAQGLRPYWEQSRKTANSLGFRWFRLNLGIATSAA